MAEKKKAADHVLKIVVCGMLLAVDVVLARVASLNTGTERFGLALFAVAMAAYLYGPVEAAIVHGLADIIGALLFPQGAYFPGFTVTAVLVGVVYGVCYHRKEVKFWHILLAVVSTQLLCTLGLNTLWMGILSNKGFVFHLIKRLPQAAVATPVQLIGTPILFRLLKLHIKPLLERKRGG